MIWTRVVCLLGAAAASASAAEIYSFWIQACSGEIATRSGCDAGDPELARWALEAWQKAAGAGLRFAAAEKQDEARIRIYWLSGRSQLYGEAQMISVNGKRGAAIVVLPDLRQLGSGIAAAGGNDRLFRDTVVYLTCLHESGHAIGLEHTAEFSDIMYSFQYGGDIVEYFSRYRRKLKERLDIRANSGISGADGKRAEARREPVCKPLSRMVG